MSAIIDIEQLKINLLKIEQLKDTYNLPQHVYLDDETGVEKYWVDENDILHIKFVAYRNVVELPVGGNEEILCEDDHYIPCVWDEEDGWCQLTDCCVECGYFVDECYCEEEDEPGECQTKATLTGIDGVEYDI
jgi:hypothetical protein